MTCNVTRENDYAKIYVQTSSVRRTFRRRAKDSFGKTGFSITCEIGTLLAHVTAEKDGSAYEQ